MFILLGVKVRDFLSLSFLSAAEQRLDDQVILYQIFVFHTTHLRISVNSPSETILSLRSRGSASPESRLLMRVIPGISWASIGPSDPEAAPIVELGATVSGILKEVLDEFRSLAFPWPRWLRTGNSIESVMVDKVEICISMSSGCCVCSENTKDGKARQGWSFVLHGSFCTSCSIYLVSCRKMHDDNVRSLPQSRKMRSQEHIQPKVVMWGPVRISPATEVIRTSSQVEHISRNHN